MKKTGRFFSNIKLEGKDEYKGIKKPSEGNINKSLKRENEIIKRFGSMNNYLEETEIDCKSQKEKELYISAEGIVLPCCWLAGQMYKLYWPPKHGDIWRYIDDRINIKTNSLEDIFKSGIFDKIEESWYFPLCEHGRMKTCALKCGKELDIFGDQFK